MKLLECRTGHRAAKPHLASIWQKFNWRTGDRLLLSLVYRPLSYGDGDLPTRVIVHNEEKPSVLTTVTTITHCQERRCLFWCRVLVSRLITTNWGYGYTWRCDRNTWWFNGNIRAIDGDPRRCNRDTRYPYSNHEFPPNPFLLLQNNTRRFWQNDVTFLVNPAL